jgi:glutamine synthetase
MVLLHENLAVLTASGKHNNWSMLTDTGKLVSAPVKNAQNQFNVPYIFFVNYKAVANDYAGFHTGASGKCREMITD